MSQVTILGVRIDALTMAQAVERMQGYLAGSAQHHVMTPNSEMLVEAARTPSFCALLNRTSLNLPDSAGLLWAARWTGQRLPQRVAGVDAVQALCAELTEETPVFLLGAGEGVAEAAGRVLQSHNPHVQIVGAFAGTPRAEDAADITHRVNRSGARLLLVAYGAPAQDMWIDAHLAQMPSVAVAMGVGGTFDFLAGVQKRAPRFMRGLHLEWLWRVLREPRRIGRIINAVVVFPAYVMRRGR